MILGQDFRISLVLGSYKDDGKVIMKGFVQSHPFEKISASSRNQT